jgi:Protein of unknown function (DUF1439)
MASYIAQRRPTDNAGMMHLHTPRQRAILVVASAIALSACSYIQGKFTLEFSAQQIQTAIAPKFPMEKCPLPLTCFTLGNPQVSLQENSDRITMGFDVKLSFMQRPVTGTTTLSAKPRYQSSTGELYLDDARMEALQLQGVPPEINALGVQYAAGLVQPVLKNTPIYSFKEAKTERLAKMGIADVKVVGGKLQVSIDPSFAQSVNAVH